MLELVGVVESKELELGAFFDNIRIPLSAAAFPIGILAVYVIEEGNGLTTTEVLLS